MTILKTLSRISMIDTSKNPEAKRILEHRLRKRRREGPDDTAMRVLLFERGGNITVVHYIVIIMAFACYVQTANTLTLVYYGIEVLLQKQLALPASSVHLASLLHLASSVHPATSSVHQPVLIQNFLRCNSFLLLHTYRLSLIIPSQSQLCSRI